MQSPNTDELYKDAPKLEAALRALPQLQDVTSDLQVKNPQLTCKWIATRPMRSASLRKQVSDALYSAYGTRQISTIYTPNQRVLRHRRACCRSIRTIRRDLSSLYVRSSTGKLVPLDTVAKLVPSAAGRCTVNHLGQLPAVTLSFNLKPGVALGDATRVGAETANEDPAEQRQRHLPGNGAGLPAVVHWNGHCCWSRPVLVIYIILGILYESFIHPLTILSGLPSAGVGALATLILFHQELNLYSFVGIIMLIGIVKKNAIMMIDFALEAERNEGKTSGRFHLRGRAGPLPSHHDDDHGRSDGHAADRHRASARVRSRAAVWDWPWSAACSSRSS